MEQSNDGIEFTVKDTPKNFSYWLSRPYVSATLKQDLDKANLLIVPTENFREKDGPFFPNGTEDFLDFLRSNSREGLVPDICIDDSQYQVIALHNALVVIGGVVVSALLAPVVVDLVAEYIKRKIWVDKEAETSVKFSMTIVEEDGRAEKMSYEGPAATFQKTIGSRLKAPSGRKNPGLEKK